MNVYAVYRSPPSRNQATNVPKLRPPSPHSFNGQECVDILLQIMENKRDRLVVILAGYKDRMDEFFECNPGMSSRIAHHVNFAPYELDELVGIGRGMLDHASYYLSDEGKYSEVL